MYLEYKNTDTISLLTKYAVLLLVIYDKIILIISTYYLPIASDVWLSNVNGVSSIRNKKLEYWITRDGLTQFNDLYLHFASGWAETIIVHFHHDLCHEMYVRVESYFPSHRN